MAKVEYFETLPDPQLSPYVACYWVLEGYRQATAEPAPPERVFPDGRMELVFHRLEPFACADQWGAFVEQPSSFLFGQLRHYVLLRPPARMQTIGVRFHPAGASALLGMSVDEVTHRFVSLHELWGRGASEIEERVLGAPSVSLALGVLEGFLLSRLEAVHAIDPLVAHALDTIDTMTNAGRDIRVKDIALSTGISERQLERKFRGCVGLGPKRVAAIARLQRVIRLIQQRPGLNLTESALLGGYYDQAHFNRSFRQLAGLTPLRFMRETHVMTRHFLSS